MGAHSIRAAIAATLGLLLVLTACESAPKPGVIDGTAVPCDGPGPVRLPTSMTILVKDTAGKPIAHRTVPAPYHFRFVLNRGNYVVSASDHNDPPETVHVQPGSTASVQLTNACV